MKKLIIILFALIALLLSGFYLYQKFSVEEVVEAQHSKVIIPVTQTEVQTIETEESFDLASETIISYIPLQPDETLLHAYSVSLAKAQTGDQVDDQVCVVKKAGNEKLILLVGLYNNITASYSRAAEIETPISQFNTFTFSCLDIVGQHQNAIVITGFSDEKKTVMQVYLPTISRQSMTLEKIADFSTEGTLFIQESSRSDAYSLNQAMGESFPIIENCPDPNAGSNSMDQLQITYKWNPQTRIYERTTIQKIPGRTINAQELSKILDGTVATFSKFLDGLWYKSSGNSKEMRYIFFDTENNEIVCFVNESQEVYSINTSWMRRNGITMTTENKSMSALSRSFAVTLVSTDEIKIKATDDLKMTIGEETLWDGNYKKQDNKKIASEESMFSTKYTEILKTSLNKWTLADGSFVSVDKNQWVHENNGIFTRGVFTEIEKQGENFLEFRGDSANSVFSGYYFVKSFETQTETEILVLQPVTINVSGVFINGETITLQRKLTVD
ncbi:MAG: pallilysin-related adhesin [Spirochaetaceae bacterium]|nr:pallilysin-related adhesin [Spirochaetaceae bacterium]